MAEHPKEPGKHIGRIRTTIGRAGMVAFALLSVAVLFLSSCSSIKVGEIPSPYEEDIVLGKVIKEIRIEGNETTDDDIILMSLESKVGEVYTAENVLVDSRRLYGLGIFTAVHFSTIEESDGVILIVDVLEVNPYIPAPSIKITEENGLEIGVSVSSTNLFGRATRLSAFARGGGATNIGLKLKEPWLPGDPWYLGSGNLEYAHMERYNPVWDFDEKSDDAFLTITRSITNSLRWGPKLMFLSVASKQPGTTLDPDNQDNMPGAGLFLQRDARNLSIYPTDGSWAELLVTYTGGSANYWQGTLDYRRYFPVAGERHSLAFYTLTTLTSGEVGVDIPVYQQFAIGGANTIRGWGLGKRRGKNQFLNTAEYWFLWVEPKTYEVWFLKQALGLQLALLADVGTAWTTGDEFHQNWILGGGAGLRITIPSNIMFRFDVAYGESGATVGILIGSGEKAAAQRARVR